jgi:hypothetical protein
MFAGPNTYKAAQKTVTPDIINLILAKGLKDLEPRPIHHGYNTKVIAGLLNVCPSVVRSFLHSQLPLGRTQDLKEQMLQMGIPV